MNCYFRGGCIGDYTLEMVSDFKIVLLNSAVFYAVLASSFR